MCAACSSGTSAGERKLMPTIEDELNRRQMLYSLLMPVMNLWVTHLSSSSSFFNFYSAVYAFMEIVFVVLRSVS